MGVRYGAAMATVILPAQLRRFADGRRDHPVEAATVTDALVALERRNPDLGGYVLDEQRRLRRHLSVFVNGVQATAGDRLQAADELLVLTSISGGSDETAVLVGTRKGLFVLGGERGGPLEIRGRQFEGVPVEYAIRDPRSGRYLAAVTNPWFGPRIHVADDPLGEWTATEGPVFPESAGATVERVWVIQPGEREGELWAGTAPAALFRSQDGGDTWELVESLWNVPSRPRWEGGAGGLCLHTICPWPGEPDRLLIGVSAAGIWITNDGCRTWEMGNAGISAPYLPEDFEPEFQFCIHHAERSPVDPTRLWMQFHGSVYRSDDAGSSWNDVADGLPAKFGFPIVADPTDRDRAWVVPLTADLDRVPPDGRLGVWETTDGGNGWSNTGAGLPAGSYQTVLRQAFCHDGRDPLGLYFGVTSGELFGSADAGASWRTAATRLPGILSVRPG